MLMFMQRSINQSVDKLGLTQNIEYLVVLLCIVLVCWFLLILRKRLNEEIRSYGVTHDAGEFFVEAHRFSLDRDGRLLFWKHGRLIAAVETGKWQRVREGLTLEDFEE